MDADNLIPEFHCVLVDQISLPALFDFSTSKCWRYFELLSEVAHFSGIHSLLRILIGLKVPL